MPFNFTPSSRALEMVWPRTASGGPLARVVADEDRRGERLVDALHHLQRTRKSAHDPHIVGQLVDEEALPVAVRVGDDDLGGARGADAGDRRVDLAGHPFARALVLESLRAQLRRLHHAADALHVDRDEYLPAARRLRVRRRKQERQEQQGRKQASHGGHIVPADHAGRHE